MPSIPSKTLLCLYASSLMVWPLKTACFAGFDQKSTDLHTVGRLPLALQVPAYTHISPLQVWVFLSDLSNSEILSFKSLRIVVSALAISEVILKQSAIDPVRRERERWNGLTYAVKSYHVALPSFEAQEQAFMERSSLWAGCWVCDYRLSVVCDRVQGTSFRFHIIGDICSSHLSRIKMDLFFLVINSVVNSDLRWIIFAIVLVPIQGRHVFRSVSEWKCWPQQCRIPEVLSTVLSLPLRVSATVLALEFSHASGSR